MVSLKSRVETWVRDQTSKMESTWQHPVLPSPPTWRGWQWQWPPWRGREEEKKRLREELELRRNQLKELCRAVKAESIADLQEVLCSMVLAECVYKRPACEMMKYINKFKSDFGDQIVSLQRVQPSLDHVSHRYLLAEDGDTLFASFIGTKQYRDVIADMNILQGAIFNEEYLDMVDINGDEENPNISLNEKTKRLKKSKPAAHKGFLARAKGIPALELYNLAQKKNRKLVLCGHSLGGAVAVLATLSILRVMAKLNESNNNNDNKLQVKCITFSQPPVGNEALRDYVHEKGWQNYFKTYCIPEDLVPRLLSPAYFHHYNNTTQTLEKETKKIEQNNKNSNSNLNFQKTPLVLGLGPVQTSFWRLSKLVPIEAVTKNIKKMKKIENKNEEINVNSNLSTQSLEICEGKEGISLTPLPDNSINKNNNNGNNNNNVNNNGYNNNNKQWGRVPSLPSYVPFGQLYLLGDSSVQSLSDSEYSKMTSVKSVITELKDRLQSHSMRSYRSRFQKIYESCMCSNISPFVSIDQMPQITHLQQLLGLSEANKVELGHIVQPPIIRTATSIVPVGFTGVPGDKMSEQLKIDVLGHGLHLCTLVQAYFNGNWCSTAVESLPSDPEYLQNYETAPDLQKMRVLVGPPVKKPPKYPINEDSLFPIHVSPISDSLFDERENGTYEERESGTNDGFRNFVIYCTSDFVTVRKEVHVRTRRVRLLGLEGSGKTSLFRAILGQSGENNIPNLDYYSNESKGVSGGLCYLDSPGLNLQDLNSETTRFREELQTGLKDLTKKTDLIILVHNLSHKIPNYPLNNQNNPNPNSVIPSLSLLLNEAKSLQIPFILAITNKYSVSNHQKDKLIKSSIEAYQVSPNLTAIVNSSPFFVPNLVNNGNLKEASRRIGFRVFEKKEIIMPIEGVNELREIVHGVLHNNEEVAFKELAEERLSKELAREGEAILNAKNNPPKKDNSITAAAVGASLGAGLGLVMAIVMGAASGLRKP